MRINRNITLVEIDRRSNKHQRINKIDSRLFATLIDKSLTATVGFVERTMNDKRETDANLYLRIFNNY